MHIFQATISGNIWLNSLGSFVGMKFPQSLPQWVTDLFTVGYHNINFWQIVQIIGIILIIVEYTQYDKKLKLQNEKPNATTTAVFAMLAIGLSLITFSNYDTKNKRNEDCKRCLVEAAQQVEQVHQVLVHQVLVHQVLVHQVLVHQVLVHQVLIIRAGRRP